MNLSDMANYIAIIFEGCKNTGNNIQEKCMAANLQDILIGKAILSIKRA